MTATSHQMAAARRYRIERYLTEGGMGAIYIGKKLGPGGFEKEVVLKQLLPEYTSRPEFRDSFLPRSEISATLDHANIVHTFDLVDPTSRCSSSWSTCAAPTCARSSAARSCAAASSRPAPRCTSRSRCSAGLAYAHSARDARARRSAIIHRDVSPSNILCSAQGEVKLSDFGIAKAATHSSRVLPACAARSATCRPSRRATRPIDHRTDLYSVAVCLYEALTAERLFVGDLSTPADVLYSQPIVPPSQKRPHRCRARSTP